MNWGIISCANIAKAAIIPAILNNEEDKLVAVSSRSVDKANTFARQFDCKAYYDYQAILDDDSIDAVYIPLPTGLHYEWVLRAIKAGKHILVEKSAATTYAEAEEMIALAKANNICLIENFQFQYHSQHQHVKKMIKDGELGEIRCFRSSFGFPPFDVDNNIRYDKGLGGGALLDAGAYTLKATTFILDDAFTVKSSFLADSKEYDVDWFGGAFLVNEDKTIFSEVAFGFDNYYQCSYEVWGSKGKLTSTRAYTAKPGFEPTIIVEKPSGTETIKLPSDNHFSNMIKHFNETVNRGNYEGEYKKILDQSKLIAQVLKHSKL